MNETIDQHICESGLIQIKSVIEITKSDPTLFVESMHLAIEEKTIKLINYPFKDVNSAIERHLNLIDVIIVLCKLNNADNINIFKKTLYRFIKNLAGK